MSSVHVPARVRRAVRVRAGGHCEYCLVPEQLSFHPHQVDHIVARKHGGANNAGNLALSCIACNQSKGADLSSLDPRTGELTAIFHPRRDAWRDHFALRGPFIVARTPEGRVTARLLRFNAPERIAEREWLATAGALRG